ncbi:hypothetical protein [Polynucleobacter antarcticus]|uniref:Lipoprotein n=1 Tax=Polynucleobacter antarcticus TaxID=1743162 RepID=A0A6M9PX42_9BURK|nr:hypothetical protein [Polynucleobacter antarcticus]QKM63325.1 hypothetical protein DCO16_09915 [Polynucleobacter antarcticus]
MKNIYKLILIGLITLSGCASNPPVKNPVQVAKAIAPIHTESVRKKLNDCIVRTNQGADALLVDSQIIAVTRNNPHANALFNSADKLTDQQATALKNYLAQANECQVLAIEGVSPRINAIYQEFFKNIDRVYADLIARKITIGVANQERQLLIHDARMKRLDVQTEKK